jgi:hypothetical protein
MKGSRDKVIMTNLMTVFLSLDLESPLRILPGSSLSKGIVGSLRSQYGGNLHDQGIIEIFASPCVNKKVQTGFTVAAKNVLDFENDTLYLVEDSAGQMIGYDFKTMRICPSHYSLRSNSNPASGAHLKSWKIEVSNDISSEWIEIDQRIHNQGLNKGPYTSVLFPIQCPPKTGYRYIRLISTGTTCKLNNWLYLPGFEVFGDLRESEEP